MPKPKVIVILGPTASGKSELGVRIAKKFRGEIISADSRQVYRGLNIGTGKITKKEMSGVKHHLLDVVSPNRKFTVVDFQSKSSHAIENILNIGKIPIVVGGTGFYIDALTKNEIYPAVKPNLKLRKLLELIPASDLFKQLKKLDPARAKNIDAHNRVRLIRAIEIAKALGRVPKILKNEPEYEFIKIGLRVPEDKFQKKVENRVKGMFKAGLLREIKKLRKSGVSEKRLREFGFEYNEPTEQSVIKGTLKYAKRQITWFKRDKEIKWFELNSKKDYKKIISFLEKEVSRKPK